MSVSRISLTIDGAIGQLRIVRPEKLNALDVAMVDDLATRCREIEHHDDIRIVVLSGEGKAFSAGGDIEAWSSESPERFGRHWIRDGHAAFDALARLRQPVIAVLDGHALGGGLELAACADIRIAEEHVKIGQPESGLGIVPGWSGTQRAVRRFGAQTVRRMALFGEVLAAEEALKLGIIDKLVPSGAGPVAALELAQAVMVAAQVEIDLEAAVVLGDLHDLAAELLDFLDNRRIGSPILLGRSRPDQREGDPNRHGDAPHGNLPFLNPGWEP